MPYKFVQGFERGYKHKGAWDARPQSSINVLIEESLRSPHSLEGERVVYVTLPPIPGFLRSFLERVQEVLRGSYFKFWGLEWF